MIEGGTPPQWMLRAPLFKDAIERYVNQLHAHRALRGVTVQPRAVSDGQRALPPAEDIIDVDALDVKPTTSKLDMYVSYLREHGPATDQEAAKDTGLEPSTIRGFRHAQKQRFVRDGGRPARWQLAE
jgi:hypothetical protein